VIVAVLGVMTLCGSMRADELHVPSEYGTIQAAINACADGDTVIVADGTYSGAGNRNIDFLGKAITVKSQNGPDNCIIDCKNTGRGFYFHNGEDTSSVLEGFTIINGYASGNWSLNGGGGIYCRSSSPMISNCILKRNSATYGGGMFIFSFAKPIITNCIFANNVANNRGGGIYNSDNSDTVITNCIFTGNWAKADHGGGFFNGNQGCPILVHCTFTGNQAEGGYGGGVYNFNPHQSFITLANCIFWLNIGSGRMDEQAQIYGGPIVINYCCIQGLASIGGTGNIGDDPLFAGPDDYWLLPFSPCIDAGIDAGVYMDIEGNLRPYNFPGVDNNGELPEFDMGAYEAMPVPQPFLVGLEILGPNEVAENFSAQYRAIAVHDNNSTKDVTDLADWSVEPNDIASIAGGLLTTEMVDLPTDITITAQYSEGDVNQTAEKQVSILTICPSGSALDFDGVDDYINCGDILDNEIGNVFTIGVWIKLGEGALQKTFNYVLWKNDDMPGIRVNSSGSVSFVHWYTGSDGGFQSTHALEEGKWYYISYVFNGSEFIGYINAEYAGATPDSGYSPGGNLLIASDEKSYRRFKGVIDDIRIYNRALSAEEVQASMHIRPDTDDPNLVAYWDFDEGEGQIAGDSAGGNNGTLGSTQDVDSSDPEWVVSDAPVGICTPVDIDIKPDSCPNPLNLASRGVLPVAILGSEGFEVNTIDVASIFLEGVPAIRSNYEDVAAPVSDGNECECTTASPDGYPDLTLKFYTQEIVEELINWPGGLNKDQTLALELRGELTDGRVIAGRDCVVLVGNVPRHLFIKISDINGDGIINIVDLAQLAQYWLESY
jgi:hypothetical protein